MMGNYILWRIIISLEGVWREMPEGIHMPRSQCRGGYVYVELRSEYLRTRICISRLHICMYMSIYMENGEYV